MATNLSSPFGGHNEDEPSVRFQGIDVDPADAARRAARRVPADAAVSMPASSPSALDGTIVTPYNHSFNVVVGRELGQGFSFEGGVRRTPRAQPAGAARRGDAGEHQGPGVGARLLHGRRAVDSAPRRDRRQRAAVGLCSASPNQPYWENMFPDAAGGRPDGDPADGERVQPRMRRTTSRRSTGRSSSVDPACSKLGEFAFFAPSTTRSGSRARSGAPNTTRCSCRCGSGSAPATSST